MRAVAAGMAEGKGWVMEKLIQAIQEIQQKLPSLRRQGLKETPTRTIIIDVLLEALGWHVREPDQVELEYPTVDGKSVDYALKLNNSPVILVEAKALGDTLDDVKAITQVVGYAANNGIIWCILTNGVLWRVYRSVENCPAPEKLIFEVNIDPNAPGAMSVQELARRMWFFSREEMARGTLDNLGKQTVMDRRVRKALEQLMLNPPTKFLKLVRDTIGDNTLSLAGIKGSLERIIKQSPQLREGAGTLMPATVVTKPASVPGKARRGDSRYDETHHLAGKPQETVALYRAIEKICLSMEPSAVTRRYRCETVNFAYNGRYFCSVQVRKKLLRVFVRLRYKDLQDPPAFARDVSHVYHFGVGDTELRISSQSECDQAAAMIRQSFEAVKAKT